MASSNSVKIRRLGLRILGKFLRELGHKVSDAQSFVEKMHWLANVMADDDKSRPVISASKYNMLNSKGEDFYARQYWELIKVKIFELIDYPTILDLGSGQGRLSLLLANKLPKAKVISTDISNGAITELRVVAAERRLTNIHAECRSISEVLSNTIPDSIDLILLTEVSFYYPAWREDLPRILSALKPGGIFISSHRSRYFNILLLSRFKRYAAARSLLTKSTGRLFGSSSMIFEWSSSQEISTLLETHGFKVEGVSGIGTCSGISGDPHDLFAQPGLLNISDQENLLDIEIEMGRQVPDAGRYMLFIAMKP